MEFKKPIYPIEQWNITETEFKKENNYRNETTFALSNGYIGTRGTFEEAYPFDVDTGLEGNFVNGFYESNEYFIIRNRRKILIICQFIFHHIHRF